MPETRPPSMADVAALAGVSQQTVSRVLNDYSKVRATTREKVLDAIAKLGYRPNLAARALATSRTTVLGILASGSESFGPVSTVYAIEKAARNAGYATSIVSLPDFDPKATESSLSFLLDRGVDAIIVVAAMEGVTAALDQISPPCPVVVIGDRPDIPSDSAARYVFVDQEKGAQLAMEHLYSLGHRNIWHIKGPSGWFDANARLRAYHDFMVSHELEPMVIDADSWAASRGFVAGIEFAASAKQQEGPTAVFVANDPLALGLLRALWEAGFRVPDDISVVGFDDIEPSEFLVPGLTTIKQPFVQLGVDAVQAALDALIGKVGSNNPRVAFTELPELVVRSSTTHPKGLS